MITGLKQSNREKFVCPSVCQKLFKVWSFTHYNTNMSNVEGLKSHENGFYLDTFHSLSSLFPDDTALSRVYITRGTLTTRQTVFIMLCDSSGLSTFELDICWVYFVSNRWFNLRRRKSKRCYPESGDTVTFQFDSQRSTEHEERYTVRSKASELCAVDCEK